MDFDFGAYYAARRGLVDTALRKAVPALKPARLKQAMEYSLLAPGKRLRPVLVIAAAEACGAAAAKVLPTACAFEALHTYSLIHDDLPAMDDDDLRRGRPTCHKAFDEATAILAGDALLTLAFELVAKNAEVRGVDAAHALEASRVLARAAGGQGMVGGQMADIEAEGRAIGLSGLKAIHAGKTGALITAALECGAVLAGAKAPRRKALALFGRHLGLAFQVADDILNVVGDQAKLGKRVGSDAAAHKATYPALLGLQNAKKTAHNEFQSALAALEPFGPAGEALRGLARFVVERDV
ncbi:MAG TPA: farnesyl diphosphate synthase [bacterium]|jgi:geranylgeranyl diphosphate synthase type II|nr:farnesyl diphosphate synthase [bacterium]